MVEQYLVFCEFRAADLKPIRAAKRRGLRTAVVTMNPHILDGLPWSQRDEASLIDRMVLIDDWEDHHRVRDATRRALGTVAGWYTGLDEPSRTVAALRGEDGLPTTDPEVIELYLDKARIKAHYALKGRSRLRVVPDRDIIQIIERNAPWPFPGRSGFLQRARGAGGHGTDEACDADRLKQIRDELGVARADTPSLTRFMRGTTEFVLVEAARGTLYSFEAFVSGAKLYPIGFTRPPATRGRSALPRSKADARMPPPLRPSRSRRDRGGPVEVAGRGRVSSCHHSLRTDGRGLRRLRSDRHERVPPDRRTLPMGNR